MAKTPILILAFLVLVLPCSAQLTGPDTGRSRDYKKGPVGISAPQKPPDTQATPTPESPLPEGSGSEEPPDSQPEHLGDELKRSYSKVLEDMVQGIYEGDYSRFARHLSQQMRATQTRQSFLTLQKKIQTNLGKLRSTEYLGFYSQGGFNMALFKARFSKDRDDVLITLVFDRKALPPQVGGFWLDSPSLEK